MGKTIMRVAAVSLDGFIADDKDYVGPLFDWLGIGDVSWSCRAATARPAAPRPRPTS
jgi:hypothetical protein